MQSNAIHEVFVNTDKTVNEIPNIPSKTSSFKFNKITPAPQFILSSSQSVQQKTTPLLVSQPPTTQLVSQPPTTQFVSTSQFLQQPLPTPQFLHQPQPLQSDQPPIALPTPQQGFGQKLSKRPALELEVPNVSDPSSNNVFFQTRVNQPSIELEAPYFESDQYAQTNMQNNAQRQKPSIDLEPPFQDDSLKTVETNVLAGLSQIKRDNINRQFEKSNVDKEPAESETSGFIQSNSTLDDRFTQVYILPSGKEPVRGPYEHPDLVQNKVIFTDWNSLLQQKPDESLPISNFNEYVNGKIPGEEEEDAQNPTDDLQRDFSNYPRPFSFASTTERLENSGTEQSVRRVSSDATNPFSSNSQPAKDLLPPFYTNDAVSPNNQFSPFPQGPSSSDITKVTFGNTAAFDSYSAQQANTPALGQSYDGDDNNTVVIQNPFQHPFYKIRKMNDERNIIFIPLTDSDFALELRKVPLNRTRIARRMVMRKRKMNRDTEQEQEFPKCGHCHQGYLIDRERCVPCITLT